MPIFFGHRKAMAFFITGQATLAFKKYFHISPTFFLSNTVYIDEGFLSAPKLDSWKHQFK